MEKHILIVDDDPNYARLVHDWLKDSYKVTMVTSGQQALKWLTNHDVDLMLLDYEMPEMPGPQVIEKMRDDPILAQLPVMVLTGKNDRESIMRILSLDPADYLLKNIEKAELEEKLQAFFEKN